MVTRSQTSVHQRVTDVAFDLFYRQGYHDTGINQIISASGVAKASFYDHFPAKEDLLIHYARYTCDTEIQLLRDSVQTKTSASDRFFALIEALDPWLNGTDYRGCPFQNLMAEIPKDNARLREIAQEHRQNLRNLLMPLAKDLLAEITTPQPFTPETLVDAYLLLLEGAVVLAVLNRDSTPCHQAVATLKTMIGSK